MLREVIQKIKEGHRITGAMKDWNDMIECFNDNFPVHVLPHTIIEGDMKKDFEFSFDEGKLVIKYSIDEREFSISTKDGKDYDEGQSWQEYLKWALLDVGMDATALRKCE